MALFDSLRRVIGRPPSPLAAASPAQREVQPDEVKVPEIRAQDLIPQYREGAAPLLLDCREVFEWRQVRIPGSRHIPMNEIPGRLAELDPHQEWIVVCAHGNRSYGVAGYLIHRGYQASSLAGGVTDWSMCGGPIESDFR